MTTHICIISIPSIKFDSEGYLPSAADKKERTWWRIKEKTLGVTLYENAPYPTSRYLFSTRQVSGSTDWRAFSLKKWWLYGSQCFPRFPLFLFSFFFHETRLSWKYPEELLFSGRDPKKLNPVAFRWTERAKVYIIQRDTVDSVFSYCAMFLFCCKGPFRKSWTFFRVWN